MRRIADLYPGEGKTDARDAFVIADAARTLPHALRRVGPDEQTIVALGVLAGYDADLAAESTHTNRLHAALLHVHPALERLLGKHFVAAGCSSSWPQPAPRPGAPASAGQSEDEGGQAGDEADSADDVRAGDGSLLRPQWRRARWARRCRSSWSRLCPMRRRSSACAEGSDGLGGVKQAGRLLAETLAGLASALEIERVEDYGGSVAGRDAGQAAAGVGAGAGEEQGLDGGAVVRQGR